MGWNTESANYILQKVMDQLSLSGKAYLIRFGSNAIFHLFHPNMVIRITPPSANSDIEMQQLDCVQYMINKGVPCAFPVSDYPPMVVEGCHVSFWHYLEKSLERMDYGDFGEALKQLHMTGKSYNKPLPVYDFVGKIQKRLDYLRSENIAEPSDLAVMQQALKDLSATYTDFSSVLGTGVIHGDAHGGNVIRTADGQFLCDLDSFALGYREWDLVPVLVGHIRFTVDDVLYNNFCQGYGYDLREHPQCQSLVNLRELSMISWLYQNKGLSDKVDAEITFRMRCLKDDDRVSKWKPN